MTSQEFDEYMSRIGHLKGKRTKPEPTKEYKPVSFEDIVAKTFKDAESLLLKKHKDYGPLNIAHAPGGAMNGLMVRMHDKMERLKHLTYQVPDQKPHYESIEDTLIDLANYAIIGLLVQRGQWEGTK
jgi:hypothetical protein